MRRPSSPLSPSYKASAHHFDAALQPPSPRGHHHHHLHHPHTRPSSHIQRRAPTTTLKLPPLPRFHPANFPSSHHSSMQSTPESQSPQSLAPVSPRAPQRMYSDAQKQLYFHQREMLATALRASSPSQAGRPTSPRLVPLGSPGPVTPLELEGDEGYLLAGVRLSGKKDGRAPDELVQQMIMDETRRLHARNPSPRPGSGRS
ncbi:hypothetical protein MRB53_039950 [Persea americana]|nr:hypothetical protein MRB53_039950 [Persea americana]